MNFPGLILIIAAHFLAGRGLLAFFRIQQKPLVLFLLSVITGIVLLSQVPFLLQLCYIPITPAYVAAGICLLVAVLTIPHLRTYDYRLLKSVLPRKFPPLYDLVFMLTIIVLLLPAIWLCFLFPPYARDMLSGPEPLAQYAIREHTLINSIFTVNLESTNNQLKPPYVAGLQIIYKMFVNPFGQLWVIVMALCFIAWIFTLLREKLHPLVAGVIMLFFICAPDVYAYTYVMLFDYSNMVLFFAGLYFLSQYLEHGRKNEFFFSAFLFGLATAIRSETLILVAIIALLPLAYFIKHKVHLWLAGIRIIVFCGIPFLFYYIWIGVYLQYYIPYGFNLSGQINHNPGDLSPLFTRFAGINTSLIFGGLNIEIYGWIIYLFLAVLLCDLIFYRKFSREARVMLYGIATVYFGMAFIGYLIPWVDLGNTTKRGLFKFIPMMVLYMRNSGSLLALSARIRQYEWPAPKKVGNTAVTPQPQRVQPSVKKKKK